MPKMSLPETKKYLLIKEQELKERLESLKGQDPSSVPGWENENTQDDDAFEREGRSRAEALTKNTLQSLTNVRRSLEKIEKGTYGECDGCGKDIDPARLEMIPEAFYCISCQRNVE